MLTMSEPIALAGYEALAERYHRLGPTKPHNAYYDRPATLALLPDVSRKRVLDAGCGPGLYSEALLARGATVVAFDVSPEMLRYFRERNGDQAELHQHDMAQPLDFVADGSIDVVLAALSLDYVADWKAVFTEFSRLLAEGGHFVFSITHPAVDFYEYHHEGNYFEVEHVVEWWRFETDRDQFEIHHYRRPLSALFDALAAGGFTLERFVEPRPTLEFREADPAEYTRLMRSPGFLCVRARKTPR